jgi:hypothetical protein
MQTGFSSKKSFNKVQKKRKKDTAYLTLAG